jgi:hypothetical protein
MQVLQSDRTMSHHPAEKSLYQREIEATDGGMDALVYGLHGPM